MYFTDQQKKAILFIAIVFLLTLVFQVVRTYVTGDAQYDFSAFEKQFISRRDSIRQYLHAESTKVTQSVDVRGATSASQGEVEPDFRVIDINRAGAEELQRLPRIGPKIALRIVEYRNKNGNFRRPEDLLKVKGIGPKTFAGLKPLVRAGEK